MAATHTGTLTGVASVEAVPWGKGRDIAWVYIPQRHQTEGEVHMAAHGTCAGKVEGKGTGGQKTKIWEREG